MKIQIGSKFRLGQDPIMALAIPGAEILEVVNRTEEYPFDHVELTRKQIIHLRDELNILLIKEENEKELENEK